MRTATEVKRHAEQPHHHPPAPIIGGTRRRTSPRRIASATAPPFRSTTPGSSSTPASRTADRHAARRGRRPAGNTAATSGRGQKPRHRGQLPRPDPRQRHRAVPGRRHRTLNQTKTGMSAVPGMGSSFSIGSSDAADLPLSHTLLCVCRRDGRAFSRAVRLACRSSCWWARVQVLIIAGSGRGRPTDT